MTTRVLRRARDVIRRRGFVTAVLLQPAWLLAADVVVACLLVIVLVTVPLARAAQHGAQRQVEAAMMQLAGAIAATVDVAGHEQLRDPAADSAALQRRLHAPLLRFMAALPAVQNLYTLRREGDTRLVFMLDAAREPDFPRAGALPTKLLEPLEYDQASEPLWLPTVFGGEAYVDQHAYAWDGTRATGRTRTVSVPLFDAGGAVVAMLGMDYDEQQLAEAMAARKRMVIAVCLLIDVVLLLSVGILVYVLRRRLGVALGLLETEIKTDALTGLFNRRYFNRRLAREVAAAAGSGQPLGLLVFDVDHFKRVNDAFGHPAGDRVLEHIAAAMRGLDAASPLVGCRIGGEEFALLVPGQGVAATGALFARLAAAVRQPVAVGAQSLSVTVSGGIAVLGPGGEDADSLLRRADQALYRAKESGRDTVQIAGVD